MAFGRAKRFLGNGRQDIALAWPGVAFPPRSASSQYQAGDSGRLSVPAGIKLHVCHITAWGGRRLACRMEMSSKLKSFQPLKKGPMLHI